MRSKPDTVGPPILSFAANGLLTHNIPYWELRAALAI
jgi:hypothetical protein